jgi:hypothetical protein
MKRAGGGKGRIGGSMTNESALECMEESIEVDQSLRRCCFSFMRVEKSIFYREEN